MNFIIFIVLEYYTVHSHIYPLSLFQSLLYLLYCLAFGHFVISCLSSPAFFFFSLIRLSKKEVICFFNFYFPTFGMCEHPLYLVIFVPFFSDFIHNLCPYLYFWGIGPF